MLIRPGLACGSNSTSRSTSLSGRAVPFSVEPNTDKSRMRCSRQMEAKASGSGNNASRMTPLLGENFVRKQVAARPQGGASVFEFDMRALQAALDGERRA